MVSYVRKYCRFLLCWIRSVRPGNLRKKGIWNMTYVIAQYIYILNSASNSNKSKMMAQSLIE